MTPPSKPPRQALGRGLAALISSSSSTNNSRSNDSGFRLLSIDLIEPNKSQPRKSFDDASMMDLATSIKEQGVLQPIVVRRLDNGYEIVAGERRWRAAAKAGLHEIPAMVKELTDRSVLEMALVENIQREDLDPLEEAETYSRLTRDHGLTQEQLAAAVGKNRSTVANSLRLLKLPDPLLDLLADGTLTAGHARAIMSLRDAPKQQQLANAVIAKKMSVRETERRARALSKSAKSSSSTATKSASETALEERLMRAFSTKVRLVHRKGKGRIEIDFHSLDQLDELLSRLNV